MLWTKTISIRVSGFMIDNKLNFFFKNQIWHLGGMILLFYIGSQIIDFENTSNTFLGISTKNWFMFSMMIAILHQGYVWLCWRSELCWKTISRTIGFKSYVVGFFIVFLLRFSTIGLCVVDFASLFNPSFIAWIIAGIISVPVIYTLYSVHKYFGFIRATGIDHFDPNYKNIPFEKRGIFKWIPNAMYTFGLLLFLCFAIISGSKAMFVVAVYYYIGAWIHYFATEKVDINIIYGK